MYGENDSTLVTDFAAKLGIPESKLDTVFMLQPTQVCLHVCVPVPCCTVK